MTESRPVFTGDVVAIYTTPQEGKPTQARDQVKAVAGRGLEGDRYFFDRAPDADPGERSEITLIELEAIEALRHDLGTEFALGDSRRNVITRNVPLNHLIARRFRVGDATLEGVRLAEPCEYLEGLTFKGVRKALIHRGGLRARIVDGGTIRVGDAVSPDA
jgi:MOSC domain-containing protein YiiM